MKNYYWVDYHRCIKTYCRYEWTALGLYLEVFIPTKYTVSVKMGKWSETVRVVNFNKTVDNRKYRIGIIISHKEFKPQLWDWFYTEYAATVIDKICSNFIKFY